MLKATDRKKLPHCTIQNSLKLVSLDTSSDMTQWKIGYYTRRKIRGEMEKRQTHKSMSHVTLKTD